MCSRTKCCSNLPTMQERVVCTQQAQRRKRVLESNTSTHCAARYSCIECKQRTNDDRECLRSNRSSNEPQTMREHIECIKRTNENEECSRATHRCCVPHTIHASSARNEQTKRMGAREQTVLATDRRRCKKTSSAFNKHNEEKVCSRATHRNNMQHAIHASNGQTMTRSV